MASAGRPTVRIGPFSDDLYRIEISTVVDAPTAMELVRVLGYPVAVEPKTEQPSEPRAALQILE